MPLERSAPIGATCMGRSPRIPVIRRYEQNHLALSEYENGAAPL